MLRLVAGFVFVRSSFMSTFKFECIDVEIGSDTMEIQSHFQLLNCNFPLSSIGNFPLTQIETLRHQLAPCQSLVSSFFRFCCLKCHTNRVQFCRTNRISHGLLSSFSRSLVCALIKSDIAMMLPPPTMAFILIQMLINKTLS